MGYINQMLIPSHVLLFCDRKDFFYKTRFNPIVLIVVVFFICTPGHTVIMTAVILVSLFGPGLGREMFLRPCDENRGSPTVKT